MFGPDRSSGGEETIPSSLTILNAKLRIPNVTDTLKRKRLIDCLRGIYGKKLALVTAGAGFGKTVLVAQTIAAMKADVAWCALDELDADAGDFIRCLIAAIRQQYPDFAIGLSQKFAMPITSKRNRDLLMLEFLAETEAHVRRNMILVLDDYHLVQDGPHVSGIIEFLLARIPPVLHLIVISRSDPVLKISRYRAMREVIDIGEADLAFQPDETQRLYRDILGMNLHEKTIQTLIEKTGGWAAGLVLFHGALKEKTAVDAAKCLLEIGPVKQRFYQYMDENIFQHQADDIRVFMMDSSLLSRLNSDFCDAFLNRNNSREILTGLCQKHLLIFPLGEEGIFFRYHHLLQDFLRDRLLQQHGREEVNKRHRHIALLMEKQGDIQGALHHFLEGSNPDAVCRILAGMKATELLGCTLPFLANVFKRLPIAIIDKDANLLYLKAKLASLNGHIRDAINGFETAMKGFQADENPMGIAGCQKDLGFHYYLTGDVSAAKQQIEALRGTVHTDPFFHLEVLGYLILFSAILGEMTAADRYYESAMRSECEWGQLEKPLFQGWLNLCYGNRFHFSGDFEKAHSLTEAALNAFMQMGMEPFLPLTYFQAALCAYYRCETATGGQYAENGIHLAAKIGIQDHQYAWLLYAKALNGVDAGELNQTLRDASAALELFKDHGNCWGEASVHELMGMIFQRIGKPFDAKNCFQSGLRAIEGQKLIVIRGGLVLRLAGILVDEGEYEAAQFLLDSHAADINVSAFHQFERHLLGAGIHAEKGHLEQAAFALEPGLTLAFRYQYGAWFLRDAARMAPVLVTCYRLGIMREYIEGVFRQAGHRGKSALQALKRAPDGRMRGIAAELTAILPAQAPRPLIIRCLGKFEVSVDGRKIPSGSWRSLAATRLFKFLVIKTGQGFVPKDVLLEFLWPEENPEVTNKRFHVALSALRKLLEPGLKRGVASAYILRLKDAYRLETGPGGRIDVKAFLSEIDAADRIIKRDEAEAMNRYLSAESLYGGPLFAEDLFVEAFSSDRNLLQQRYQHVLSKLLHLFEQNENWTACLSHAEKYLALEPSSEPVHCAIMRCYFALGETARIAAAFNRCRSLITAELGCPPGLEVEQLYRQLMETRFESSRPAFSERAYPRLISD